MAATSGSSTPQLHPEPWKWMKKHCICMLSSFHSYSENWLLFLLHAQFFPGESWILHYEYIIYIHLPLCKRQFCLFVIRFPRPFQNWTLYSSSSQKASFWKCWGYSHLFVVLEQTYSRSRAFSGDPSTSWDWRLQEDHSCPALRRWCS